MSALPNVVKAASGKTIRLAKQIGKGGEGAVFEVDGKPELAVKIYWPQKAADLSHRCFIGSQWDFCRLRDEENRWA